MNRHICTAVFAKFQQGGRPSAADARGLKGRGGRGILGEKHQAPPHQLRGLGERFKLPHRGSGRSPGKENVEFSAFWDLKIVSRQCKIMAFAQVFAHRSQKVRGQTPLCGPRS